MRRSYRKKSNADVGEVIIKSALSVLAKKHICLAVQCCEHLNRALVVEESVANRYGLERVTVIPILHAGGALAAAEYRSRQTIYNVV
nr:DUF436 family protein [Treponema phagedenis]